MTTKAKGTKTELDEIVPEYNSSIFVVKKLFHDRIKYMIRLANIKDGMTLLDVGCGIGYLLQKAMEKNNKCRLFGIDINENVAALNIPGCNIKVDDIAKLSTKDDFFDIIFALDTLEHIEDVKPAIINIRRMLKKDGQFIVGGPTESLFYKIGRFLIKGTFSEKKGPAISPHHHTIYTLNKKILKAGFVKEKTVNLPKLSPLPLEQIIRYRNAK